jgi:hypothetical protein
MLVVLEGSWGAVCSVPRTGEHILQTHSRGAADNRGMSQEALAERADLHRTYVGGVERA